MDEKELDKMAKDIEPIEEPKEASEEDSSEEAKTEVKSGVPAGFVEDKETYVKPDGKTATIPVRNLIREDSGAKKWMIGGLATILIVGLGASTAWLYIEERDTRNEMQSIKTGLDAARADAAKLRADAAKPIAEPATGEDFNAFSTEYDKMIKASVELTDVDEVAIESGIKTYYKLPTLPEGWQIVTGYKDAKADETTGKPINALVLWPAGDQKPAGFFEMNQDAEGKWTYSDLR